MSLLRCCFHPASTCAHPCAAGLIECEPCSRYRTTHGAACPEAVWGRRKKKGGSKPVRIGADECLDSMQMLQRGCVGLAQEEGRQQAGEG